MRQQSLPAQAMREYLEQSSVHRSFQQRLEAVRNSLTTPIGPAARMVGVTEAQLRYWESLELLSPARSGQDSQAKERGQRHYGAEQLARALIIKDLLEQSFNLSDIGPFIKNESLFIERVMTEAPPAAEDQAEAEQPYSAIQQMRAAEEALLWQFFIPRAFYAALSLLFENTFGGDGRIYLPIRDVGVLPEPVRIERMEDLPRLGEVLLGYREPHHAFAAFPVKAPPLEPAGKYEIIRLEEVIPADPASMPVGVHLALVPSYAALLRLKGGPKPQSIAARKAAGRLLKFMQDRAPDWKRALRMAKEALLFDSPQLINRYLGEPLLNALAETVVELGGLDQQTKKPLWRFCCILLPEDLLKPLMVRSLVIQGQSKEAPHVVGVTKLSPTPYLAASHNASLSVLAYQNGSLIYRSRVTPDDPAIALHEREEPLGSAIAVPLEGEFGRAGGVLYVVSERQDAFSVEGQQLLRILGRIIGEQVVGSRSRALITSNLPDLLEDPESVEPILKGLPTVNGFRRELRTLLKAVAQGEEKAFEQLSFIAIDIDDLSSIANKYGDQAATRNLISAVVKRIQEHVFPRVAGAAVYRAYMDRFYLLLKNISLDQARDYAGQLKAALEEAYRIYGRQVSLEQMSSQEDRLELHITTRFGFAVYSYDDFRERLTHESVGTNDPVERFIDHLELQLNDLLKPRIVGGSVSPGDVV